MKIYNFKGGFHPADHKELSAGKKERELPLLPKYTVILRQNVGSAPELCVKKGDIVKKGTLIAKEGAGLSVPLHSPVAGTVGDTVLVPGPNAGMVEAVEILTDREEQVWDTSLPPIPDWRDTPVKILKQRILDGGVTGMGGAAFPTHIKLSPPPEKIVDMYKLWEQGYDVVEGVKENRGKEGVLHIYR